jgi:glucokinase
VIGIDLGGTKLLGIVSDEKSRIIKSVKMPTDAHKGRDHVINKIFALIETLVREAGIPIRDVDAISICSPGPLDSKKGRILFSPNLSGFKNIDIVDMIQSKYGIAACLENDANAAAFGEYLYGAGRGCENFAYITVSTGIGCGLIINGRIYRGHSGNAGELGEIIVEAQPDKFLEEWDGALERIASGKAIARAAKLLLPGNPLSVLNKLTEISTEDVFDAARNGDRFAENIVTNCMNYLGVGIFNLINIIDPERIVLGGGVVKAGDIVFRQIEAALRQKSGHSLAGKVEIVPAQLGEQSGVLGALALVSEQKSIA